MANRKRAKKKTSSKKSQKKAPKKAKKAAPKANARGKAAKADKKTATRKGKAARGTEVERRWSNYLEQRTSLELAVEEVRAAEASLATAREQERKERSNFDEAKAALEQLLEVEPALGARGSTHRSLGDIPVLSPKGRAEEPNLG